jgi:ATP-dependent Clp protease adaptor protein ClpS
MSDIEIRSKPATLTRVARPKLHKVILLNDDYTPREFVVSVLALVFRMNRSQANAVMLTAHQRGVCVVAVFTREIAETKATQATDLGRREGYPLTFTTAPED